ncbi:MAG: MBL fold metallo-hydrolase [Clostridia bacterium]|nr:MBL fold metallo-hydrolase [Clostridia bacterium]
MLDLTFLGVGSAFHPELGNTAAYFVRGKTLFLLDCGSLVYAQLVQHELLQKAEHIIALITHTHADHAGSLPTLVSHCRHITGASITVAHPENTVDVLLLASGITADQYARQRETSMEAEGISIRFLPVPHSKSMHAYGLLLQDQDETVYYSGDAGDMPEKIWQGFLGGGIDRVYQDVALNGKKGGSHGEYQWFASHCPISRKQVFFPMHLSPACRAQAAADGFPQVAYLP